MGDVGRGSDSQWLKSMTNAPGNPTEKAMSETGLVQPSNHNVTKQNTNEAKKKPAGMMASAYMGNSRASSPTRANGLASDGARRHTVDTRFMPANPTHSHKIMRGKKTGLKAPPKSANFKPIVEKSSAKGMSNSAMAPIDFSVSTSYPLNEIGGFAIATVKRFATDHFKPAALIKLMLDSYSAR